MTETAPSPPAHHPTCPECGASNAPHSNVCWLCRRRMAGFATEPAANGQAEPARAVGAVCYRQPSHPVPNAAQQTHFQFTLASLMLSVTLCAVIMGAAALDPGLGIGLAILVAPAFIHTAVTAVRRRERGRRMEPYEKMLFFLGSFGAVLVTLAAVGSAFFATCFGGFFAGAAVAEGVGVNGRYASLGVGLWTGIVLGAVAGVVVLVLVVRLYVRRYRRRSE